MTDDAPDHAARLDALEAHFAHQDRLIAELNTVITAQWRKIDMLERHIARLNDEFQAVGHQRDAPEPPPPHY
jgi:SlyX protein